MTDFESFFRQREFDWKPGLERIKKAINEIDFTKNKSVIIVGTNGKGSTATSLAEILTNQGIKTGLFTSPHLKKPNERFKINLTDIDNKNLNVVFNKLLPTIEKHKLTYFETCFLMAVYMFSDCDVSIYEAGLGGRLDATNAIKHDVAVLTNVSIDHERFLGNSPEEIAREKLHVSAKIPLVISENAPKVLELAGKFTDEIYYYGKDFKAHNVKFNHEGTQFTYVDHSGYLRVKTPLVGKHQSYNVSTALFTSKLIADNTPEFGSEISLNTSVPGRFQKLRENPLLVVDVAHNVAAIKSLIKTIRSFDVDFDIVYSGLKDKNIADILKEIYRYTSGRETKLFITQINNERAMKLSEILSLAKKNGINATPIKNIKEVIYRKNATLVAGSFYLVSDIMSYVC